MKRAGIKCAKRIYVLCRKKKIIVLCGPGNNGGDGLVISQFLKSLNVEVILYCLNKKTYKGDALKAYKRNKLIKNDLKKLKIPRNSLIVDCLFGIGLNRKIKGIFRNIVEKVNSSEAKVISIDIPSGINGNTGKPMGLAVKADFTYALHAKKNGHIYNSGKKYSGTITIIDIGIKE